MSKTKKEQRRQANLLANRIRKNLADANASDDPLSTSLMAFTSMEIKIANDDGNLMARKINIKFYKSPLPQHLHEGCLELFEKNVKFHFEDETKPATSFKSQSLEHWPKVFTCPSLF